MKNESVKKSLKQSKNVLEQKRKNSQAKNLHKKDQHVYNNCYELRSKAIKHAEISTSLFICMSGAFRTFANVATLSDLNTKFQAIDIGQ